MPEKRQILHKRNISKISDKTLTILCIFLKLVLATQCKICKYACMFVRVKSSIFNNCSITKNSNPVDLETDNICPLPIYTYYNLKVYLLFIIYIIFERNTKVFVALKNFNYWVNNNILYCYYKKNLWQPYVPRSRYDMRCRFVVKHQRRLTTVFLVHCGNTMYLTSPSRMQIWTMLKNAPSKLPHTAQVVRGVEMCT